MLDIYQVKKIADQLEESERSTTTENWGLFLARKEAAFRGQQQVRLDAAVGVHSVDFIDAIWNLEPV